MLTPVVIATFQPRQTLEHAALCALFRALLHKSEADPQSFQPLPHSLRVYPGWRQERHSHFGIPVKAEPLRATSHPSSFTFPALSPLALCSIAPPSRDGAAITRRPSGNPFRICTYEKLGRGTRGTATPGCAPTRADRRRGPSSLPDRAYKAARGFRFYLQLSTSTFNLVTSLPAARRSTRTASSDRCAASPSDSRWLPP